MYTLEEIKEIYLSGSMDYAQDCFDDFVAEHNDADVQHDLKLCLSSLDWAPMRREEREAIEEIFDRAISWYEFAELESYCTIEEQ